MVHQIGICQIDNLPKDYNEYGFFFLFEEGRYEYNDTISRNKLDEEGRPLVSYFKNDSTTIREAYYSDGYLKSKCEIIQLVFIDTTTKFNYQTMASEVIFPKKLRDLPHGDYVEYYSQEHISIKRRGEPKVKTKGKFHEGIRIGEWHRYDNRGNKIIVNYNFRGKLEGEYKEFKYNIRDSLYIIQVEGEYGIKFDEKTRRTGTWKYYTREGELMEVVEHNWLLEEQKNYKLNRILVDKPTDNSLKIYVLSDKLVNYQNQRISIKDFRQEILKDLQTQSEITLIPNNNTSRAFYEKVYRVLVKCINLERDKLSDENYSKEYDKLSINEKDEINKLSSFTIYETLPK